MSVDSSIIPDFSHSARTYKWVLIEFHFHAFFNKTLSPVRFKYGYLQRFSFWLPLFINACFSCLINCQLASWLILRIASLPNTSRDGLCYVVVCTKDCMVNIVDEEIPSQGLSLSKWISWIFKVRKILPIVWCTLSIIELACGFLTLMRLFHGHFPP